MQSSLELRWFRKGVLPKAVVQWFESDLLGGYLSPPEDHQELYLIIPNCHYLALKVRQKGLEVRWRERQLEVMCLGKQCEGIPEKWIKWFCTESLNSLLPTLPGTGQWLEVKKRRSQRVYQMLPNGHLVSVPLEIPVLQGCNLELTQLQIQGQSWWSLGWEVFGQEAVLPENLQVFGDWIYQKYPERGLKFEDSYSHAHWLNLVLCNA